MAEALADHDRIVRQVIQDHDGHVFGTAGDSFAAVFGDASRAVDASLAVQRSLGACDFGELGGLPVRIGLHAGIAVERGGDYFGPEVNLASRVMSAAHGGQILASDVVIALSKHRGRDLGRNHLRDIPGTVHLFQVLGEGVATNFPPLHTADRSNAVLPAQLSTFIGRTEEISKLRKLLATVRLVTLTGTGGTGKTRLAIETAAAMAPGLDGAAIFVDLTSATDFDSVVSACARAAALQPDPELALLPQLFRWLQHSAGLLVVDNCEHVIDEAAEFVGHVLADAPAVAVLATSREQLDIDGEQVFKVPPLLEDDAGARLFMDRALTLEPTLEFTDEDRLAIAEICQRLDGIPLAIELAAARTRVLTPADILTRLSDRFALLTGGRRRMRQRQQTLEATVAWSYDLLDAEAQSAFRRLGVFTGTFDLAGAAAVLEQSEDDALDIIDTLVTKSMVLRSPDERGRFRLLETLRAFAETRLQSLGDVAHCRDLHLAHYLGRLPHPRIAFTGLGLTLEMLDSFAADLDNLVLAADWATTQGRTGDVAKLTAALMFTISRGRGYVEVSRNGLNRALQLDLTPTDRGLLLMCSAMLGTIERDSRSYVDAREAVELLRPVAEEDDDALSSLAAGLYWMGFIITARTAQRSGPFATGENRTEALFREADAFESRLPSDIRTFGLGCKGMVACMTGDLASGRDLSRAMRLEFEGAPSGMWVPMAIEQEIYTCLMLGEIDSALDLARSVPHARRGLWGMPDAVAAIVVIAITGDITEARRRLLAFWDQDDGPTGRIGLMSPVEGVRSQVLLACGAIRLAAGEEAAAQTLLVAGARGVRTPGGSLASVMLLMRTGMTVRDALALPASVTSRTTPDLVVEEAERTAMLEDEIEHARTQLAEAAATSS